MWISLFLGNYVEKWVEKACKWVEGGSILRSVAKTRRNKLLDKIKTTNKYNLTNKSKGCAKHQHHGLF